MKNAILKGFSGEGIRCWETSSKRPLRSSTPMINSELLLQTEARGQEHAASTLESPANMQLSTSKYMDANLMLQCLCGTPWLLLSSQTSPNVLAGTAQISCGTLTGRHRSVFFLPSSCPFYPPMLLVAYCSGQTRSLQFLSFWIQGCVINHVDQQRRNVSLVWFCARNFKWRNLVKRKERLLGRIIRPDASTSRLLRKGIMYSRA